MSDRDTMRWAGRGVALAALVIGWLFIGWQNHFHASAPVVFVCLGYLAVVATVFNLWRTGASAVAADSDEDDSTWAKPSGALGELERERRTLLKAIKEAEFDQQMGKLSDRDALDMIETYKSRIYEVYAEIDKLQLGAAGSKREAILREVKARLEVDARAGKKGKPGGKAEAKATGKKAKQAENVAEDAAEDVVENAAQAAARAAADHKPVDPIDAKAADDAAAVAAITAAKAKAAKAKADVEDYDEALNADSTTTHEPSVPKDAGVPAAKEATP